MLKSGFDEVRLHREPGKDARSLPAVSMITVIG